MPNNKHLVNLLRAILAGVFDSFVEPLLEERESWERLPSKNSPL